ncbi:MAG: Gfo/Idh/MocA family oxidoreductase [Paracoccaceae bacterium]
MLNVALVGAGSIGQIHAGNISRNDRCRLAAICDADIDRAEGLASKHGSRATTLNECLGPGIDAVIIASSTSSHGAVAETCLAEGKPFLCEKPLAGDLTEGIRLATEAKTSGLTCGLALNRRFAAEFRDLRAAIRGDAIGSVETILIISRSAAPPDPSFIRTSGGLFGEKGSHFFDLACWLTDDTPEELLACGSVLIDPGYAAVNEVDTAKVTLKMCSGAQVMCDFSWRAAYGQDERIEVHGSKGLLQNLQQPVQLYRTLSGTGLHHGGPTPDWRDRFAETYKAELDQFLTALETGDLGDVAQLQDGLRAQCLANAAYQSVRENRVVLISADDWHI